MIFMYQSAFTEELMLELANVKDDQKRRSRLMSNYRSHPVIVKQKHSVFYSESY
jgi:hypothetical protein